MSFEQHSKERMKRILAAVLLMSLASAAQQVVTVPQGTPIRLRLNQTLSSTDAHVGDRVLLEVMEDVEADGGTAVRRAGAMPPSASSA